MARIDEARSVLETLHERLPDLNDIAVARTNGLIILSLRKTSMVNSCD
ncbi:MAG: hypothetical protein ACTSRA_17335 [Promethearchaeota archaeon]